VKKKLGKQETHLLLFVHLLLLVLSLFLSLLIFSLPLTLGDDELNNMGELIETIFEVAPTRPLPITTQKPITEICAQPLTVYFEKVRNLASKQRAAVFR
jgi:hypothetical protein